MSADFLDAGERIEFWQGAQLDREAVRAWEESHRESTGSRSEEAAEVVGALLRFLADGLSLGNVAARAVALLVVVRPDLVNGCSYGELADEIRDTEQGLKRAVAQVREEFPTLRGGYARPAMSSERRMLNADYRRELIKTRSLYLRVRERRREEARDAAREMADFDRKLGLAGGDFA
ncbi:MAG: hypothetical protein KF715_15055 [Candidatus Didemnitutus sp.]|nr:hypothetical protein [Candidatus Didemnitutus sp.]